MKVDSLFDQTAKKLLKGDEKQALESGGKNAARGKNNEGKDEKTD